MTARFDLVGIWKQIVPLQQPEVPKNAFFLEGGGIWKYVDIFHI